MNKKHKINTIRNIGIIAHIDAGKTTVTERILYYTGRSYKIGEVHDGEAVMDWMPDEQERGITITSAVTTCQWEGTEIHIIDTPGHVDFSYEVSRSLAACEGALLIVDASQGVQAQTIANINLALKSNLKIIPVINKIDLTSANPDRVAKELQNISEIKEEEVILASAKEGIGTSEILEAIISKIPSPKGNLKQPLRALIFDSVYNSYKGTIVYVKVVDGAIKPGMFIQTMSNNIKYEVIEVGIFRPKMQPIKELIAGEVGYIIAGFKNIKDTHVGDTIIDTSNPSRESLPGYKKVTPLVFCSIYPIDNKEYENLKTALDKLKLNDSSLFSEDETSEALGFGFRCGFLGLLHMEIIQERLEREYDLGLIATTPSVMYQVTKKSGETIKISNPVSLPPKNKIAKIEEPYVKVNIITPSKCIGGIMDLVQERRGSFKNMEYIDEKILRLDYELPLNEIILDFYDKLKSISSGYASLDYEIIGYQPSDLEKVDILVNHQLVDALSFIVHKDKAYTRGRKIVEKLKEIIPRQMYGIPLQATIESKIMARETIKALKKDVTAKCYGGDITRKRKLLEKQKAGKKRMKKIGKVEIPQEAFLGILKI